MLKLLLGSKVGLFVILSTALTIMTLSGFVKYYKGLYDEQVIETAVVTERALSNQAKLTSGIETQNQRLKKLSNKLDIATNVIDAAVLRARIRMVKSEEEVQSILQEKEPKGCKNAIKYLNKARNIKWED